ncbi:unnamed protein product [Camellia sinensis]
MIKLSFPYILNINLHLSRNSFHMQIRIEFGSLSSILMTKTHAIVSGISPHKNWRGAYYSIFLLLFRRNYDWNFIFGYGKIPSSLELTTFCEVAFHSFLCKSMVSSF